MFALDRASRTIVAGAAFAAFTGAFVTSPFIAGGTAGRPQPPHPPAMAARTSDPIAVVVHRDPFSGPPDAVLPHATAPPAYPTLPPSFARSSAPPTPQPTPQPPRATPPPPRLTAVVTGTRPVALVELHGTTRVVAVGDRIDGTVVVAIDAGTIRLANGTALRIATRVPHATDAP